MMKLEALVNYLDLELSVSRIQDYPNALNGLQIENSGKVAFLGAAVDASEWTLNAAAELGIDFLLVHHGLFWQGNQPINGPYRRKVKRALDANLAVYSAHLPLDAHPIFGNNALLAAALEFQESEPAFLERGTLIGRLVKASVTRSTLVRTLELIVNGPVHCIPGGPEICRRIGIISGGGGTRILEAVQEAAIDTFITGEGAHWTFSAAEELGVNLLYAGHYATETFGVKALAAHLSGKFQLPWQFIDHPSGL